jgi:glutamyl-tRNA reductase
MTETAGLAAFVLHQRTASLGVRERYAIRVASLPPQPGLIAISSCHRVELYAATAHGRHAEVVHQALGPELASGVTDGRWYEGEDAARHLFRVTAGLDSVVVGEGQIAGQIRRLHAEARDRGIDPVLDRVLRRALAVARELRAMTGSHGRSVGSLAVDEALSHVPDPATATALVIGAGEIGKLSARALARRVGHLVIANRDADRARALADGIAARAVGLDALAREIGAADVVISAADTRGSLLTRELLAARCARRPLVLVDIAVPRSVAEDARDLPGLLYRDVDHLAAERAAVSPELVERAEARCAEEARAFMDDLRSRSAAGTIRALRQRAEDARRRQLDRALRKLAHLSDRDRRVVEGLASSLVGAIVHEPTVALRGSPERAEAARALFRLDADGSVDA